MATRQKTRDLAALAGRSDAAVQQATGCSWERWVHALDRAKAHEWDHRTIAAYVREKFGTPYWWAQMVTVGYERIKGLRELGQRRDGLYEAARNRTFPVSVGRLYRAFADARTRKRWLETDSFTIRAGTKDKTMRITWGDGTSVELYFTAKGKAKSAVSVQHTELTSRPEIAKRKAYWGKQLDKLGELLAPPGTSG